MSRIFNYKQSLNIVCAVSTSYVKREKICEYFEEHFDKDKTFTGDELKQIVGKLVKGKERITQTMDGIIMPNGSNDKKRNYYNPYRDDEIDR